MTLNQWKNLVQMSKCEMRKTKNPWKQKFPGTTRKKPEHEDSRHAFFRSWCAACVEGRGVGGKHRTEERRTTPIVAFDYRFLTQENPNTFPILICRDSKYGQTGATCSERKGPTAYFVSFLVGFIKDLEFSQNHFEMRQSIEYESFSRCSMCGRK